MVDPILIVAGVAGCRPPAVTEIGTPSAVRPGSAGRAGTAEAPGTVTEIVAGAEKPPAGTTTSAVVPPASAVVTVAEEPVVRFVNDGAPRA